eukprot:COSAG01_NODE_49955_length_367_cov_3.772388_1_plen_41_part_10
MRAGLSIDGADRHTVLSTPVPLYTYTVNTVARGGPPGHCIR